MNPETMTDEQLDETAHTLRREILKRKDSLRRVNAVRMHRQQRVEARIKIDSLPYDERQALLDVAKSR